MFRIELSDKTGIDIMTAASKFKHDKPQISPELKKAIFTHNEFVNNICKKHRKDNKKHDRKINEIKERRIVPNEEQKGSGLRRTFVALGYDWVHSNVIDVWKSDLKREKIERTKNEIWILGRLVYKPLLCLICLILSASLIIKAFKSRSPFTPKINLPILERGNEYLQAAGFVSSVLDEFSLFGERGIEHRWDENADAEIKYWSICLLDRFKNISAVSVKQIYVDPRHKEFFYVYCEGMLHDPKIIVKCTQVKNDYELLIIE